ncbi:MAG: glycosyltransferase family 4 protein [Hyphomicrobiales bacterium]
MIPELEAGGAERTTVDIAAALAARGDRALVASEGGRLVAELQARGGEWFDLPVAAKNPLRMVLNVGRLAALIRRERVDIIHARSRAPAWSALLAARRTGIPFVTTFHGAYKQVGRLKALYNSVMARGDAVIANSAFTAGVIAERFPSARDRIVVIPRGTDLAAFDPARITPERRNRLAAAWAIAAGDRVVLLPARVSPIKGHKVAIEAAARLAGQHPDLVFVMAGDEQGRAGFRAELDADVAAAGLAGRVRFVGHCADMPAALSLASVVIAPSLVPETFGRAAVEAGAMGRPVVVSDLGAFAETVLQPPEVDAAARTGWRVPAADANALAEAIEEALLVAPDKGADYGDKVRAFMLRHFDLPVMTGATLAVYDRLRRRVS